MPKVAELPDNATALWRWMNERHVTLGELAALLGITPQHLSDVRRGVRRPSDPLKERIASETLAIEQRMGIAERLRHGVPVTAWYKLGGAKAATP